MTGIKQSIFDQTGTFGFQFNLQVSDLTKNVNVGFTGNTSVNWHLYQGKIYDNNNAYCGSYSQNQNVFISGDIGANTFDYYINNEITAIAQNKNTGIINYGYVNTDSGNNVNFNLNVIGNIPNYTLTNNILFQTGAAATGAFINDESLASFRIFSGSGSNGNISYLGNSTGNIAPQNSGLFYNYISGATQGNTYTGAYTFYTNFGNVTTNLSFTALSSLGLSYTQFNLNVSNFSNLSGAPLNQIYDLGGVSFLSISGANYITTPFLDVQLSYVSGATGNFYGAIPSTGTGSVLSSGNVVGSATFTGFINTTGSGYDYNSVLQTGLASGSISQLVYYTGNVNQIVSILGSGFITGNNSNSYNGTGTGTVFGSGLITGSSFISLAGNVFGSGYDNSGNFITGLIPATDYQLFYATGVNNVNLSLIGSGTGSGFQTTNLMSSGVSSGYLSGYVMGSGQISGLLTGSLSGIPSGLLNPYYVFGTGGQVVTSGQTATGYFTYNYISPGNGQVTGIYNTGLGNQTGNFNLTTDISGLVSGNVTATDGILVILNPTGEPTGSSFPYSFQTGATVYTSPTGYIYYNTPASGGYISLVAYNLTFDYNYNSFTGLLGAINSTTYGSFYNGTTNVPYFTGIDIGDHNTIQLTFTPNGPGGHTNFYLINSQNYTGIYPFLGAPSGTMGVSPFAGGGAFTPSGTFNFYPSGNFIVVDNVRITGSGNYTGFVTSNIYSCEQESVSGLWPASGGFSQIYTTTIINIQSGSINIAQNFSGNPVTCTGYSGTLIPTGIFVAYLTETIASTGFNFVAYTGTYEGQVSVIVPFAPYIGSAVISGYITGIANNSGQLILNNYLITGYPIGIFTSGAFTGYYSGTYLPTGFYTEIITGSVTGAINNQLTFVRNFYNTWDLRTGTNQNSFIDFFANNYYNNNVYINPSGALTGVTGNTIFIRTDYTPLTGYTVDVANLFITGLNSGFNILITGQRI